MSVTNEEKNALADLNQRFLCYVNKVRQLKDEEDIRVINENVSLLEEELRALKGSYEAQISQLSTTVDIVVSQKIDIERELISRKNNEVQLSDRLSVEGSKMTRLLHEMSCLTNDLSVKDQELISLKLSIQQLRLEGGDDANNRIRLQHELEDSRSKNHRYEEEIVEYENKISSLTQKIEFQDQFFSKKLEDMKEKVEEHLQKMVEMDFRVAESKERESQWPLILERVHKTAAEEYNKFKSETEQYANERITNLQRQLDIEMSENDHLNKVNEGLNKKLLELRKSDAELRSKVDQLNRETNILEQALAKDKNDSEKTIVHLQNKIKELRDNFMQELDHAKTGSGSSGVQIKGEIEFLKRLLTEEERRLKMDTMGKYSLDMDGNGQRCTGYEAETNELDEDDYSDNKYANNTSTEEFLQYETETGIDNESALNQHQEPRNGVPDTGYQWSNRLSGDALAKSSSAVGPICQSELAVGPVRPISSLPHPPIARQPRPSSANVRGIRSKTVSSQPDHITNKDCSGRSSNHRLDSGIGQSPDYFDSVFRSNSNGNEPIAVSHTDDSISLTSLKVVEVNKDGKYIRVTNNSDTHDIEIGNYMIKQNRFSHPVAMFRFPDRVKIPCNGIVTIWAGSNDPLLHQPPTDFFSEEPPTWGSGPEYTTVLCNSSGQAVSWTTQSHRIQTDPYRAKTAPALHKETKREITKKLPEIVPFSSNIFSEPVFLIRDTDNTLSNPIHHPFTSTPKSSIHPCIENNRGKVVGNDNSSFNRQTRQQNDGIPDPMLGQPYTGNNVQRMIGSAHVMRHYPGIIKSSHSMNNRSPEVIFRSHTEPPNTFQKPVSRFMTGLDQVQSMHNHFYEPPMYKVDGDTTAH